VPVGVKVWTPPPTPKRLGPDPSSTRGRVAAAELARAAAPWKVTKLVSVRGGFEAATWSQKHCTGGVRIWRWDESAGRWSQIGETKVLVIEPIFPDCIGPVLGGNVAGAPDAVFIVEGQYTGDGTGNATVVANGAHGWGVVDGATTSRIASTGHGALSDPHQYDAVRWDAAFSHGLLETIDGNNGWFSDAAEAVFPYRTWWRGYARHFVNIHDDAFTARATQPPVMTSPTLPAGACPREGTYAASFGVSVGDHFSTPYGSLEMMAFPRSEHFPGHPRCTQVIPAKLPITVRIGHAAHPSDDNPGRISKARWVSAPAWLLTNFVSQSFQPTPFFGDTSRGNSWYVPSGFDANVLLTNVRDYPYESVADLGHQPHPAWGTVTFNHGRLVTIAVAS
jgi:hypothetical protein